MSPVKFMVLGLLVMAVTALTSFVNKKHSSLKTGNDKGFAVVELFTSEGCSSCPPADAVVAKIQKESADKPIYILAFHVDYWNHLGWKDIFSASAYSARQRQYSEWLHSGSVYTPQVVVNGSKEFVGSEEGTLRNTIKADLQKDAETQLNLSDIKIKGNKVNLQYKAEGNINNSTLLIAVVEKAATSKIGAGENSGRTLAHVQIVRSLSNMPAKIAGSASVSLPAGFDKKNYELIAFIQNKVNGEITGATKGTF